MTKMTKQMKFTEATSIATECISEHRLNAIYHSLSLISDRGTLLCKFPVPG